MKTFLLSILFACHVVVAGDSNVVFHFPDIAVRFRVGDTNAANPISDTEGPKALASADMNSDGLPDVIAANLDGSVSVLLGTTNAALLSQQILTPARGILTNSSLRAVVVADVNNDGLPDVIVGDIARRGIVVLLGLGDGTLLPHKRIDVGPVRALASADFNKDGKPDLLIACSPPDCDFCYGNSPTNQLPEERFLCVLEGLGGGDFSPPKFLLTPGIDACFYDVEAADIDGDSNVDALALDFSSCIQGNIVSRIRRLQIFANPGNGAFSTNAPTTILEPSGEGPRSFHVGYLDELLTPGTAATNRTLDIVVANRDSGSLDIFLNDGAFKFRAPVSYQLGASPRDIGIGDLDQDGHADLVVVNRWKNSVSLLRGTGGGAFEVTGTEVPTGVSPRNIVLADFNGDGQLDSAVNNRETSDITALRGEKDFFGFLLPGQYYWAGDTPSSAVARDFNGDGRIDFAVISLRSHELHVRLNAGDGKFPEDSVYKLNEFPGILAAGYVNQDTLLDLVVTCFGGTTNSTLLTLAGLPEGKFASPIVSPLPGLSPYWVRLGDLDNDKVLDAAVGTISGQLAVLRGKGDGSFERPILLRPISSGRPLGLALGDFDGDGLLDIATSAGELMLNNGTFFNPRAPSAKWPGPVKQFPAGAQAWAVEADDLDQDGKLDLMVALTFRRPDPIGVYYGRGDGTFVEPTIYDGPDVGVVAMASADIDGDGLKDIVIGNRCAATIMILKGVGSRKFRFDQIIKAYAVEDVEVADFNGDHLPDILGVGVGVWPLLNGVTNEFARPGLSALSDLPPRGLFINEIMAQNRDYRIVDGRSPDWLEIYNNSSLSFSLEGWQLVQSAADDKTNRWTVPAATSIPAYGHLTVYCEHSLSNALSASFELSADGETVALLRPDGSVEDWVRFPALPHDVSYARLSDGAPYFAYNIAPTIGAPNRNPPNMRPSADRKDPYVGPGASALGVNARFFDDVAIAYASVHYRVEGTQEFHELAMSDDGQHGDKLPADGYYGALLPDLPQDAVVQYFVRVVDLEGDVQTSPEDAEVKQSFHILRVPARNPNLRLTELVAANNRGIADEKGQREDWIELTNFGTEPVSLSGLALAKDYYDRANAWSFPTNTSIGAGARLLVFCDNDPRQGPLHANFTLLRDGDRIFLVETQRWTVIDSLSFNTLPANTSFGVTGQGSDAQLLAWPTPLRENLGPAPTNSFTIYRTLPEQNPPLLQVRWNALADDYMVESSSDLRTWVPVANGASLGLGYYEVEAPITPTNLFFRIRRQP